MVRHGKDFTITGIIIIITMITSIIITMITTIIFTITTVIIIITIIINKDFLSILHAEINKNNCSWVAPHEGRRMG